MAPRSGRARSARAAAGRGRARSASSRPPRRSTRRTSVSSADVSGTCSSTSEHQTRSTSPWPSGRLPSGRSSRRSAPATLRRARSSAASASSTPTAIGAGLAQRRDEAPGAAAEVEHPLAGPRLGEQQRPPPRPRPGLGVVRQRRPTRPRRSRASRGIVPDAAASGYGAGRDAPAPDPQRDAAARARRPPAAGRPDARPGGRAAAASRTPRTTAATRSSSCPSRRRSSSRGIDAVLRHAHAPRPLRRHARRGCCRRTCRSSASPRTPSACARAASRDVRPVEATAELGGIALTRTPARHGSGATRRGGWLPVSGFVLRESAGRTLYLARRHGALRRGRGACSTSSGPTSSWSTRAARASAAATRS